MLHFILRVYICQGKTKYYKKNQSNKKKILNKIKTITCPESNTISNYLIYSVKTIQSHQKKITEQ